MSRRLPCLPSLGDNYDAQEQARICKNYFLDQTYAQAEAMITDGDPLGAYNLFVTLSRLPRRGHARDRAGGGAVD